jgi:hypothetical protein
MSGKKDPGSRADRINDQVARQTGMTDEDQDMIRNHGRAVLEAAVQMGMMLHSLHPASTLAAILQMAAANLCQFFGAAQVAEFLHTYADMMEGKPAEERMAAILTRLNALTEAQATGGMQ